MFFRFLLNFVLFQVYVFDVARRLRIYPLPVVLFRTGITHRAGYFPYLLIAVNPYKLRGLTIKQIEEAARHEIRHHWQTLRHGDVCQWWRSHRDIYKRYYFCRLNWMEEDARRFSHWDEEASPACPQTVEKLEDWYQRGLL